MITKSKLVSIALPVFNAEKTLGAAIRSILIQTYDNWELIIMDDGSTDSSLMIARTFKDSRIKLFTYSERMGISFRLNQAIKMSNGEYFARMDGDDISFPGRFERQVNYMEKHSEVDLLGTGILVYRLDGSILGKLPIMETHEEICKYPWNGFYLPHPTWLGRIKWFRKNWYYSSADKVEDQHLLFRTYRNSRFACLPEVLLGYREEQRSVKKMLAKRCLFFKSLSLEAIKEKHYALVFILFLNQMSKAAGDILNIVFKMRKLRNQLLTIEKEVIEEWNNIFAKVDGAYVSTARK